MKKSERERDTLLRKIADLQCQIQRNRHAMESLQMSVGSCMQKFGERAAAARARAQPAVARAWVRARNDIDCATIPF